MRVSGIRGSAREHLREHKQTFDKKYMEETCM
nr:MAG TPA: hypothetical protein [Bacteriophage sp.]